MSRSSSSNSIKKAAQTQLTLKGCKSVLFTVFQAQGIVHLEKKHRVKSPKFQVVLGSKSNITPSLTGESVHRTISIPYDNEATLELIALSKNGNELGRHVFQLSSIRSTNSYFEGTVNLVKDERIIGTVDMRLDFSQKLVKKIVDRPSIFASCTGKHTAIYKTDILRTPGHFASCFYNGSSSSSVEHTKKEGFNVHNRSSSSSTSKGALKRSSSSNNVLPSAIKPVSSKSNSKSLSKHSSSSSSKGKARVVAAPVVVAVAAAKVAKISISSSSSNVGRHTATGAIAGGIATAGIVIAPTSGSSSHSSKKIRRPRRSSSCTSKKEKRERSISCSSHGKKDKSVVKPVVAVAAVAAAATATKVHKKERRSSSCSSIGKKKKVKAVAVVKKGSSSSSRDGKKKKAVVKPVVAVAGVAAATKVHKKERRSSSCSSIGKVKKVKAVAVVKKGSSSSSHDGKKKKVKPVVAAAGAGAAVAVLKQGSSSSSHNKTKVKKVKSTKPKVAGQRRVAPSWSSSSSSSCDSPRKLQRQHKGVRLIVKSVHGLDKINTEKGADVYVYVEDRKNKVSGKAVSVKNTKDVSFGKGHQFEFPFVGQRDIRVSFFDKESFKLDDRLGHTYVDLETVTTVPKSFVFPVKVNGVATGSLKCTVEFIEKETKKSFGIVGAAVATAAAVTATKVAKKQRRGSSCSSAGKDKSPKKKDKKDDSKVKKDKKDDKKVKKVKDEKKDEKKVKKVKDTKKVKPDGSSSGSRRSSISSVKQLVKKSTGLSSLRSRSRSVARKGSVSSSYSSTDILTKKIAIAHIPSSARSVRVNIDKGSGLADSNFTRADPYLYLEYSDSKVRGSTLKNAGSNPHFNHEFFIPFNGFRHIKVSVFDDDIGKDRHMGCFVIDLEAKLIGHGVQTQKFTAPIKVGRKIIGEVTGDVEFMDKEIEAAYCYHLQKIQY